MSIIPKTSIVPTNVFCHIHDTDGKCYVVAATIGEQALCMEGAIVHSDKSIKFENPRCVQLDFGTLKSNPWEYHPKLGSLHADALSMLRTLLRFYSAGLVVCLSGTLIAFLHHFRNEEASTKVFRCLIPLCDGRTSTRTRPVAMVSKIYGETPQAFFVPVTKQKDFEADWLVLIPTDGVRKNKAVERKCLKGRINCTSLMTLPVPKTPNWRIKNKAAVDVLLPKMMYRLGQYPAHDAPQSRTL